MAGRDTLQDPEYRNFIKALLCLSKTKEGLETFAYEKSKQFHQQVFDSLNQLNITNTGTPICKVLYNKKNTLRVVCQDSFCTNFVNEVIRLAKPFTIQKSNLENSDHKLWHSNPWELSKIFMNRGQLPSQNGPKDTDISGLLNFLLHCPTANSGVSSVQKIIEVRNVRNKLMHNASSTVNIITLQSMEHDLVTLLKDAKELANRPESLEAVTKITEIMKPDFHLEKNHENLALVALEKLKNLSEEFSKYERELKKLENKTTQLENTTADLKTKLEAKTVQIEEKVDLLERDHSKKKQLLTVQQKLIFEEWINEDKVFVETKAFKHVFDQIKRKQVITITGVSGSGKTAMARHVAIKMKKAAYIVIPLTFIEEILSNPVERNLKHLFIIDDPVGTEGVDTLRLTRVESCYDNIKKLLKQCVIKIIFTCRKHIIQHPSLINVKSLINMNIIDLNQDEFRLTEKDKDTMIKNHLDKANLTDLKDTKFSSSDIETYKFPLLCSLFVANNHYREQGYTFFNDHFGVIIDELNNLKRVDKLNYCCLIICLMFDNKFPLRYLDVFKQTLPETERIRQLMEACEIPSTSIKTIENAMQTLESVYLTKIGDEYSFIHDTLHEAVAFVFGKEYPEELLKYCTSSFIRMRISLSCSAKYYRIDLARKYYPDLCRRLIRDLQEGNFHDVFFGPLQNKELQPFFCDSLRDLKDHELEHILFKTDINFKEMKYFQQHTNTNSELLPTDTAVVRLLTEMSVKCIHFLLATGPYSVLEYCLKVSYLPPKTNLCLWSAVSLSGNVDKFNLLQKMGYKGSFSEKWPVFGMAPIHTSVMSGNIKMVRLIITHSSDLFSNGAIVDLCDNNGRTPLYMAAQNGHSDCLQLLLQNGASVDLCENDGESPLWIAAQNGHSECLQLLLQNGAFVDLCENNGASPLYAAAYDGHSDCVQLLLQKGAFVDLCDNDGVSPLCAAAYNGHADCLQLLLQNGASVDLCDNDGESPLCAAAYNGHSDCVQLLLQNGAFVDLCENDGASPLYAAAYDGHSDCLQLLLQNDASVDLCVNDGASPLWIAAHNGHSDCLQLLLQNGASVDLCRNNGVSPLLIAAKNGHSDCVQLLLQKGAFVDLCDNDGVSPLYVAAYNGHADCLQLLLQNGAFVDLCRNNGVSPLLIAAKNGHSDCVQLLLQKGAFVDLCDNDGVSPLCAAAYNGHADCLQLLLQNGASVDLCDNDGVSPLYVAAYNGHADCLQLLLQNGAFVDLCRNNGVSPLLIAAKNGHSDCVQLLLQKGAFVDLCDNDGVSPLYVAAYNGHADCLQLLLQNDASVDLCENDGVSPLWIAALNGHSDCLQLLRQYSGQYRYSQLSI